MRKNIEFTADKNSPLGRFFIMISFLVILVLTPGTYILLNYLSQHENSATELNDSWDVSYHGNDYSGVDLNTFIFDDLKRNDTVTMSRMIPADIPQRATLLIYEHFHDIVLTLDGEEFYRAETELYEAGEILGNGFHTVSLPNEAAGKTLTVTMRTSEKDAFKSIVAPKIWDADSFRRDYSSEKIYSMSLAFFFIIMGFALTFLGFLMVPRKIFGPIDILHLTCIALFSAAFGVYMLCELDIMELFSDNIVFQGFLKYFTFYMLPVFFLGYNIVDEDGKIDTWKNKIVGPMWAMYFALFILSVSLHLNFRISMRSLQPIENILLVIAVGVVMYIRIWDAVHGIKRYAASTYATILLGIVGVLAVVRYTFTSGKGGLKNSPISANVLYIAVLAFVFALIYDFMVNAVTVTREKERVRIFSKLAFSDALTGINNRQAVERYFDELDNDEKPYTVVQFDLNNLKKANDRFGHDAGDNYICKFAEILQEKYGEHGFVARNGGDEFILVVETADKETKKWLASSLENLNADLSKIDTGYEGLTLSTSYGAYSSLKGSARLPIRDALRTADARMYRMKKEMHAERI